MLAGETCLHITRKPVCAVLACACACVCVFFVCVCARRVLFSLQNEFIYQGRTAKHATDGLKLIQCLAEGALTADLFKIKTDVIFSVGKQ